jgi:hypothetical protein
MFASRVSNLHAGFRFPHLQGDGSSPIGLIPCNMICLMRFIATHDTELVRRRHLRWPCTYSLSYSFYCTSEPRFMQCSFGTCFLGFRLEYLVRHEDSRLSHKLFCWGRSIERSTQMLVDHGNQPNHRLSYTCTRHSRRGCQRG